jgi:hypothetical protein
MYFVIYERYNEFNQFEGEWLRDWNVFRFRDNAVKSIKEMKLNNDYRKFHLLKEEKI